VTLRGASVTLREATVTFRDAPAVNGAAACEPCGVSMSEPGSWMPCVATATFAIALHRVMLTVGEARALLAGVTRVVSE
jgi:hypothetical protein